MPLGGGDTSRFNGLGIGAGGECEIKGPVWGVGATSVEQVDRAVGVGIGQAAQEPSEPEMAGLLFEGDSPALGVGVGD
jgi:hypothetical protein